MTTDDTPAAIELAALELHDDGTDAYPPVFVRRRGAPFTGVAIDRQDGGETRLPYADGRPHGAARTLDPAGRLRWEAHYSAGRPVGEHRSWAADGALGRRDLYDETGRWLSSEVFDPSGQRRWEHTPERTRTWYADGCLRSDRAGPAGERSVFLRDGRRALVEGVRALDPPTVHAHYRFDDAALADGMMELLGDLEFEHAVWMWIHRRLDAEDVGALADLRRALGHPELGVRAMALQLVGHRRLHDLTDDVRAMLDDRRVPPLRLGEYPGQGGRGHSLSIATLARETLEKLRA